VEIYQNRAKYERIQKINLGRRFSFDFKWGKRTDVRINNSKLLQYFVNPINKKKRINISIENEREIFICRLCGSLG